jgi:hypothetical protein
MCRLSGNLGASASWNPQDLSRPVQDCFIAFLCYRQQILRILRNCKKIHLISMNTCWLISEIGCKLSDFDPVSLDSCFGVVGRNDTVSCKDHVVSVVDEWISMEYWLDDTYRGKLEYRWSATLSTINPTWTGLGSNPGFRSERSTTNRLSHSTVCHCWKFNSSRPYVHVHR